jgi:hypothetical protein
MLSEHPEFGVDTDVNSIETCLAHVAQANVVLCIVGNRYGPSLSKLGYEDVSATHLEYLRARELRKPLHFFVRDTTMGAFNVWDKDKDRIGRSYHPISEKDAAYLFPWIEEHRKFSRDADANNWVNIYTNSVDLRARVGVLLSRIAQNVVIREAINNDTLPLLALRTGAGARPNEWEINLSVFNYGARPVFDVAYSLSAANNSISVVREPSRLWHDDFGLVICRRTWRDQKPPNQAVSLDLRIDFTTMRGLRIRETFEVSSTVGSTKASAELKRIEILHFTQFDVGSPDG